MVLLLIHSLNSAEHSLSGMCIFGVIPTLQRQPTSTFRLGSSCDFSLLPLELHCCWSRSAPWCTGALGLISLGICRFRQGILGTWLHRWDCRFGWATFCLSRGRERCVALAFSSSLLFSVGVFVDCSPLHRYEGPASWYVSPPWPRDSQ